MLDERKLKLCELLLLGEQKTTIAQIIGVSRKSLYEWLKDPEVLNELGRMEDDIKTSSNEKLIGRLDTYIDKLHTLAVTTGDKRTQCTALIYLVDRVLGRISTRIENVTDGKEIVPVDVLEQDIAEFELEEIQKLKLIK
jgi:hypothetical protein